MKIEIYFFNKKILSEIKSPILVKDLISQIGKSFSLSSTNYFLISSSQKILDQSQVIDPRDYQSLKTPLKFFLIEKRKEEMPLIMPHLGPKNIEGVKTLIMKVTNAKKPIQGNITGSNPQNVPGGDGGHLGRLMELLQMIEEGNALMRVHRVGGPGNGPLEANEGYLRQLMDMGFPEDRARQALIDTRNNLGRATDLLLGESGND